MRLATASGRRSQQSPDQTSTYRCGRSRLRRLGQPYQPLPRPEFFNGIGQERKPDPGDDQVRFAPIVLKKSALLAESQHWVGRARLPSSGRRLRDRDQLGELAEVLGGGGEEELVLGTIRAPQAQAVELQDTLEVGEQHLDLLPLAA